MNFSSTRPNDNCTGVKHCIPRCDNKFAPPNKLKCSNMFHDQAQTPEYPAGDGNLKFYITPLFFKMAQNLDLRCVLVSAPWVLGPKHVSIRPRL